ncbi:MAG: transcription antitermination factor NusB [Bacteroidales bacterium]
MYSCNFVDNIDLVVIEKNFIKSLEKTKELFIWQIALGVELIDFAQKRIEDGKNKFLPTVEDLNPNTRFVENRLLNQWKNNKEIVSEISYYKVDWSNHIEVIRRLYNNIKESEDFNTYLNNKDSYENDKQIVSLIYSNIIFNDDFFIDFYETKNISWYTDFCILNFGINKFIENYQESFDEFYKLPSLVKKDTTESETDLEYSTLLLKSVILHNDKYVKTIEKRVINWDIERVSLVDMIIMQMALSEFLNFPTIPIKVTINEYIEISKIFSTPKSRFFINGILDTLVVELKKDNQINKTGRGLIE